jgi:FAD/FMN-containing dehydrogenase
MSHEERLARVVAAVKERRASDGHASLRKQAVSHFVPNPHDPRHRDRKLDVRDLNHILSLDVEARRCTAEPGVTFADLVRETLKVGLAPKLVPELETITLGGAVAGCAVESMAHRHGGFHDSCLEYELVTAAGEVVRCSRERDTELFEMVHGSYGTLGVLTQLTFELIPAAPFVHMRYLRFDSYEALHARMVAACDEPGVDFVDAIGHARDTFVLCLGTFTQTAPESPSSYRGEKIFYRSTLERTEDTLTTYDYFFRYDTDCHWATQTLPGMRSAIGRKLLGRFMLGSTNLLRWTERLRPLFKLQKHAPVVIDLFVPKNGAAQFYRWYEREVGYYPLWLVPYRMRAPYAFLSESHCSGDDLYIDFAVYGLPNDRPDRDYSRMLERYTFELQGIKTLISENHYDAATFWRIYDRPRYQRVKQRVDPGNLFRDVFEKMCLRGTEPESEKPLTQMSVAERTR